MPTLRDTRPWTGGIRLAFLALAVMTVVFGCDRQKNSYVAPPPPKVTVSRPLSRPVTDYIQFTGSTQWVESVDLSARVDGYLKSVNFADGSIVKKGTLLFVIEPDQYEADLQQARADLAVQEAKLKRSETELQRSGKLFQEKAGSESDVVKWQQERDSARAAIAMAKAKIDRATLSLGYTRIYAPFTGRIGRRQVDPGNVVGPGGKSLLATITRFDPIYAYFNLNERDLLRLRQGKTGPGPRDDIQLELGMSSEEGFPHKGRLDFADLGVDPTTGTLLLRGIFPNEDWAVLPGLFTRIRAAVSRREQALLVPERSIGLDQMGHFLLVVGQGNVIEQRPVVLGAAEDGYRVVEKGIAPDDRFVVSAMQRARPGAQVEPVEVEPGSKAGEKGKGGR